MALNRKVLPILNYIIMLPTVVCRKKISFNISPNHSKTVPASCPRSFENLIKRYLHYLYVIKYRRSSTKCFNLYFVLDYPECDLCTFQHITFSLML